VLFVGADEKLSSDGTLTVGTDDVTDNNVTDVTDVTDDVLDGDVDDDEVIAVNTEVDVDVFIDETEAAVSGKLFTITVWNVVSTFCFEIGLFTLL
jgi:hypothetical protein